MADHHALAMMADADPEAIQVLGDALIEGGWITSLRVEFAMALCLGVPLDPVPPESISTQQGRSSWHQKRSRSLQYASEQWDVYAVGGRRDWARAVLAVMIFGAWSPAKATPNYGSRCPWLPVWRNATYLQRLRRAEYKRQLDESRDRHAREVKTIAQQFGATRGSPT